MEQLTVVQPSVTFNKAECKANFEEMDKYIDELEKRYNSLICTDKKEMKSICAELNKLKKAVNDEGIRIEKESTAEVKQFRKELKQRTDRIEAIRTPLWEQVKPQSKPVEEKPKVIVKRVLMFEGDAQYIEDMINSAEFNSIKVTEVEI